MVWGTLMLVKWISGLFYVVLIRRLRVQIPSLTSYQRPWGNLLRDCSGVEIRYFLSKYFFKIKYEQIKKIKGYNHLNHAQVHPRLWRFLWSDHSMSTFLLNQVNNYSYLKSLEISTFSATAQELLFPSLQMMHWGPRCPIASMTHAICHFGKLAIIPRFHLLSSDYFSESSLKDV